MRNWRASNTCCRVEMTNAQYTPPTPTPTRLNCRVESRRRCVRTSRQSWPSFQFSAPVTCCIVNWVTTVDGCVGLHTADTTQLDSIRQDKFSTCSVSKFPSAVVVSYSCEFNTHRRRRRDADATQLDSWVASASAVCIGHYRRRHTDGRNTVPTTNSATTSTVG